MRKNIAQIPANLNRNGYLFVLPFSEIGGTELQALNLANEFKKNGYEVEICLLSAPGPLVRILESKNISYQHFEINNTSFFRKAMNIIRFSLYLSQGRFLYIYSFLPHAIIYTQVCGILNRRAKYICGIRGKLQEKSLITERILGTILRKSEFVIFNSKSIHDEISEKFRLDVKKSVVIHNGVAESVFRNKNKTEKSTKQAIVISNFHSYKNYEQLIDMIEEVSYPCKYLFCGHGSKFYIDGIKQLINERNLNDRITLIINSYDLAQLLFESDFAIHPSMMESLSNAILEEMSAGLPVLAFNVGGNWELIEDCKTGFLVNLEDKSEFVRKIEFLIQNADDRNKMGLHSIEKSKNFSFEKSFQQHIEIMKLPGQ